MATGRPAWYGGHWRATMMVSQEMKWALGLAAIGVGLIGVVWIIVYWNSRPWRR